MFRVRDAATSMNVDAATSTEPATCEVATQYDAGDQQKAAALSGKREAGGGGFGGRLGSPYGGPFGIAPAGGVFGEFRGRLAALDVATAADSRALTDPLVTRIHQAGEVAGGRTGRGLPSVTTPRRHRGKCESEGKCGAKLTVRL